MKRAVACILFALWSLPASAVSATSAASTTGPGDAYSLLIMPVRQTRPDAQYEYLGSVISQILELNLRGQENLVLADAAEDSLPPEGAPYADRLKAVRGIPGLDVFLLVDYFILDGRLHIDVMVIEAGSDRAKNCFTRVMPADLDMVKNIETMASSVAASVSKSLPMRSREEQLSRQVAAELRDRLDRDETLVAKIFSGSSEVSLCPFSGLSTGRGMGSWSAAGPMVSLPLSLEYRYLDRRLWHLGASVDLLPSDIMQADKLRSEFSVEVLAGAHSASLVSLGWSAGVFAAWCENDASAALSSYSDGDPVYPPVRRFAIGAPLEAYLSYYLDERWFARLRLAYNGLSYTFEGSPSGAYPNGAAAFRYDRGFSPWTLAQFSLRVSMGFRI